MAWCVIVLMTDAYVDAHVLRRDAMPNVLDRMLALCCSSVMYRIVDLL